MIVFPGFADYAGVVAHATFTLPSFAKINLHLQIVGKRADGYHDLCTIFQTISLRDELAFSPDRALALTCDQPNLSTGDENLIIQAATALRKRFNVSAGAKIVLRKRIPAPGGLGGGSSNAAVTLLGLVRLWELQVGIHELEELACGLGADVPFFLYGGTALGLGCGTSVTQLPDFTEKYVLIVTPDIAVPTAEVFGGLSADALTSDASNRILQICRFEARWHDLLNADLRNDLEAVTFEKFPDVAAAKAALLELGARRALMSGSGASVFGIFEKEETRQAAMKALDDRVNWRKFAVATISRKQYREALHLVC